MHGFGADLNAWMFNQPVLAEKRRVVAIDLPGHGGSVKQVEAGDAETFAAVISDALAALAIDRLHLVGHSMGGAIAVVLAGKMPTRIASLTLLAPAGLGPGDQRGIHRRLCKGAAPPRGPGAARRARARSVT